MEFRRYSDVPLDHRSASNSDIKVETLDNGTRVVRRAIYLPPRSLLLLSGEARYAWQHYIPTIRYLIYHGLHLFSTCYFSLKSSRFCVCSYVLIILLYANDKKLEVNTALSGKKMFNRCI